MQEPEPLGPESVAHAAHAGHVPARMAEVFDQAIADRVAADLENDRDGRGCRLGGQHGLGAVEPRDHLDLASHQIGRERGQAILVTISPAVLDREIGALDKAALLEPAMESCQPLRKRTERLAVEESNHRHPRLLRPRRQRPSRRRTAEKGDEVTALHHSITSLARASSASGTVRPSVVAVLRLITNSNFVGWITGRSAALAPFSTFPTYTP